jgi:hypothetical protein
MPDIHHRLTMTAPCDEIFSAVTKGILSRTFDAGVHTKAVVYEDHKRAVWRCVEGPQGWTGTEITIELLSAPRPRRGGCDPEVVLSFSHRHWAAEREDEMASSSTNWARLLLGIQRSVAFGEPEDTHE